MQVPFSELGFLYLSFLEPSSMPVLPHSFLGGSAQRLRYLCLTSVPFPGLPELLLSATHLVDLLLYNIPPSGYFSPEAMSSCLSMLTSLETLDIRFNSPQSSPDQENRRPPPPSRSVLPALKNFLYEGISEYLEELVAHIDTPQLYQFWATFFNDIDFNTPKLIRFVSHSSILKATNEAHLVFGSRTASVKLKPQASNNQYFQVIVSCGEQDWQLSSLARICAASLPLLSTTDYLFIYEPSYLDLDWKDGIENIEWLELLLPFTAVKTSTYPSNLRHVSRPLCRRSVRSGQQNCFLPYRISTWRGSRHRNLSRKALSDSFLLDSSPIALSPFLSGIESRRGMSRND